MVLIMHESDGDNVEEEEEDDCEKDIDLNNVEEWLEFRGMAFRHININIALMTGGKFLFHLFCSFDTCHL